MRSGRRTGTGGNAAPGRVKDLVTGIPGKPAPPRYEGQEITTTTGRRKRAKQVDYRPEEKVEHKPATASAADLTLKGKEVVTEARTVDKDVTAAQARSSRPRRAALTASELEKRIARYAEHLEKLTPAERRAVEEYYRRLRDLK